MEIVCESMDLLYPKSNTSHYWKKLLSYKLIVFFYSKVKGALICLNLDIYYELFLESNTSKENTSVSEVSIFTALFMNTFIPIMGCFVSAQVYSATLFTTFSRAGCVDPPLKELV